MSDTSNLTEAQLRSQIQESRDNLSASLAQLTHVLQPKVQASYVADDIKFKAKEATYNVQNTVDDAREGDPEAVKKIAVSAGIALGALALGIVRRKIKKNRRK